jgi:hypothetical protein
MGEWMYRSTSSWPRHQLEVSDQLHGSAALAPGERPRYQLDRRLGGPQSRSGRENSWPYRGSNCHPSIVQPVASRYTDWTIAAPKIFRIDELYAPSLCKVFQHEAGHILRQSKYASVLNNCNTVTGIRTLIQMAASLYDIPGHLPGSHLWNKSRPEKSVNQRVKYILKYVTNVFFT